LEDISGLELQPQINNSVSPPVELLSSNILENVSELELGLSSQINNSFSMPLLNFLEDVSGLELEIPSQVNNSLPSIGFFRNKRVKRKKKIGDYTPNSRRGRAFFGQLLQQIEQTIEKEIPLEGFWKLYLQRRGMISKVTTILKEIGGEEWEKFLANEFHVCKYICSIFILFSFH
jgi:hypothetical protein